MNASINSLTSSMVIVFTVQSALQAIVNGDITRFANAWLAIDCDCGEDSDLSNALLEMSSGL